VAQQNPILFSVSTLFSDNRIGGSAFYA